MLPRGKEYAKTAAAKVRKGGHRVRVIKVANGKYALYVKK